MKLLLLVTTLVPTATVFADDGGCTKAPQPVAECRVVHGRLNSYNGAWGAVIWVVSTKHRLGIANDSAGELLLPERLLSYLPNSEIYGDFSVCPLSPERKGQIQ